MHDPSAARCLNSMRDHLVYQDVLALRPPRNVADTPVTVRIAFSLI